MNRKRYLVITVIVVAAVIVAILLDAMLANHQPAITGLEADPEKVIPSGSCQISCNSSDRDGDELSYNWSASGGEINGEGDMVTWTAPHSTGSYNVTVTVTDGRGGEDTDYIIIEVRANRPPTITSLVADADWTLSSGSIQVTCYASDPDDDELNYEWSTNGSGISGTGAAANWTAPEEIGIYYVTAVITDGHGSSDTRTLYLSVVTGQPPIIEALLITKDRYGHCYLKTNTSPYKVGQDKNYDIECIVTDVGVELHYDWSCDGGEIAEISGDRSMITWIAPNVSGKVTITVIVSDIAGNKAIKNLPLDVVSCSPCTFKC
jgi:hypothetical protein